MATYVFLFIGHTGRIEYSKQIDCLNDEQAIDLAGRETGDYRAKVVEIWNGDCAVGLVKIRTAPICKDLTYFPTCRATCVRKPTTLKR